MAHTLDGQKPNFDLMARQYEDVAFGVKELANAAGSVVESLADALIMAGAAYAAGAASSWTGVGGAAGGVAGTLAVARAAALVQELLEIRAKVWNVCEAGLGLIAGTLSALKDFDTQELPGPYQNAAAGSHTFTRPVLPEVNLQLDSGFVTGAVGGDKFNGSTGGGGGTGSW